jgi:hypothetical protein
MLAVLEAEAEDLALMDNVVRDTRATGKVD